MGLRAFVVACKLDMCLIMSLHEAACIYGCVQIKHVFDNEHARGCVHLWLRAN